MKYAVIAPVAAGTTADPEWMTGFAKHVESCGFESLVLVEHTVMMSEYTSTYPYAPSGRVELPANCPVPDPLEMATWLAARTERLQLATGVLVLPNHHPVVLAKRLATLDRLSGGRLRVCVGMGWLREELEACDVPFEARGRRADEQLAVLRTLWSGGDDGVDHDGEFFSFRNAVCRPGPVRPWGVPIHIGGHTKAAARRAGRFGQGLQPLGVAGERLQELLDLMHRTAEENGRDPETLELSLGHLVTKVDADRADRLAALGATRLVLAASDSADLDRQRDEISACAERLGIARD